MLDDLRNTALSSYEEEEPNFPDEPAASQPRRRKPQRQSSGGMTAAQRFVLALMFLVMVCLVGSFFLILTEKVYLPFF
ncbi:MAG: hypothetical protein HPY76_01715 [Anaerolineae bacterium]|nr:hypothetical protein [Anaerolineae bacterium]